MVTVTKEKSFSLQQNVLFILPWLFRCVVSRLCSQGCGATAASQRLTSPGGADPLAWHLKVPPPPRWGTLLPRDVRRPAGGLSWNPRQRRIRAALKDAGQAWWAAANSAGRSENIELN